AESSTIEDAYDSVVPDLIVCRRDVFLLIVLDTPHIANFVSRPVRETEVGPGEWNRGTGIVVLALSLASYFRCAKGFRASLVNAVLDLHAAQIIHGQLDPRHVLLRDGRPCIIDFSRASVGHICDGSQSLLGIGEGRIEFGREVDPGKDGFGCDEMYEILKAMRVWRPATLRMCGSDHWDARLVQDPQALADAALAW
ncbi:unnamed protein product, partial [Peniophora sp. CBMAI 1063]